MGERKGFLPYAAGFFYAFSIAFFSAFCLITAYDIPVDGEFILSGCVLLAVFFTALAAVKSPYLSLGLSLLPFLTLLLDEVLSAFMTGMYTATAYVTVTLASFYPLLGGLSSYAAGLAGDSGTMFFLFLCALLAFVFAQVTVRRGSLLPALGLPILILAPCMFIVEIVPALWALLPLIGALCLLVLTQGQRHLSAPSGGKLTFQLMLPVALLVALICFIWPKEGYERPKWPDDLREELNYRLECLTAKAVGQSADISEFPAIAQIAAGVYTGSVDLSSLGPRHYTGVRVMQVKSETGGSIYLRGASLSNYGGNAWSTPDLSQYPNLMAFSPLTSAASGGTATLSVRTSGAMDVVFTPYYLFSIPDGYAAEADWFIENSAGTLAYSLQYSAAWESEGEIPEDYDFYAKAVNLNVPEDIRDALVDIAQKAGLYDVPESELPQAVADYVKNAAEYDLNTPAVPDGEDFVLWFLTESHQGYCVHFASAACLLLRTMGIPARYVSGYLASARADRWSGVADSDAHAWVEYYVGGVGWLPLDATPSAGIGFTAPLTAETASPSPTAASPTPSASASATPKASAAPEANPSPTPKASAGTKASTAGSGSGQDSEKSLGWLRLLLIPPAAAAPFGYRYGVLLYRKKRYRALTGNAKALFIWRDILRLSGALKTEPPEVLYDLALKARFSAHTLTKEELVKLIAHADTLRNVLLASGLLKRVYYKYVLVLV